MNYNITISTYEEDNLLFKENTTCLLEDDYLTYHTDNDTVRINLEKFKFIKENNDTILKITKNNCTLTLKELNNSLEIPLEYINFTHNDNHIEIIYKLVSQEQKLKIVIDIGEIKDDI